MKKASELFTVLKYGFGTILMQPIRKKIRIVQYSDVDWPTLLKTCLKIEQ